MAQLEEWKPLLRNDDRLVKPVRRTYCVSAYICSERLQSFITSHPPSKSHLCEIYPGNRTVLGTAIRNNPNKAFETSLVKESQQPQNDHL